MAKTLKITLVKSVIGAPPKQKKTVEALGLKKLHQSVELGDHHRQQEVPSAKVSHLLNVEEL